MKVAFVGAGSMAEAIIAGLVNKQICEGTNIYITNRENEDKMNDLENKYGIQPTYQMEELLKDADLVILAVKPNDAEAVLQKIKPYIDSKTVLVSVMAGISMQFIQERLYPNCAIARAMPNTSASIGKSATAITFNELVMDKQKQLTETVFSAIGITTIVEEDQLDAITALSGSGPAYVYYVVEAMEQAAYEVGLDPNIAKQLIIQTIAGAAEMLQTTGIEAAELRKAVTSPGGTTEAGLQVLQKEQVNDAFIACIKAAKQQSKKLGQALESETIG